jgi:hypothetical protein
LKPKFQSLIFVITAMPRAAAAGRGHALAAEKLPGDLQHVKAPATFAGGGFVVVRFGFDAFLLTVKFTKHTNKIPRPVRAFRFGFARFPLVAKIRSR